MTESFKEEAEKLTDKERIEDLEAMVLNLSTLVLGMKDLVLKTQRELHHLASTLNQSTYIPEPEKEPESTGPILTIVQPTEEE